MKLKRIGMALVLAAFLTGCSGGDQAASMSGSMAVGGDGRNGEYIPAADWWKLAPNHDDTWGWGDMGSVSAIDPDRVFGVTWGDKNDAG